MKLGALFSGGKDSTYAAWLTKQQGHELVCLISIFSSNNESYMFHTSKIELTKEQAKLMNLPIIIQKTKGVKEDELNDLEKAIKSAIKKYKIQGITTGALHSQYQASRIQAICDKLKIKCINPLWHKDEIEYLSDLIKNKFKVIITHVAAEGLDDSWIGREIDKQFIHDINILKQKYKIHPAGEGGEFESLVLDCPLFKKPLKIIDKKNQRRKK
ncbi:diphthine--ammonia ligase [Candidatus Pacearchaeota archaeon]|nr:diphthine--ammonia ligase [Candidatus Pacearchaeota archaeon]